MFCVSHRPRVVLELSSSFDLPKNKEKSIKLDIPLPFPSAADKADDELEMTTVCHRPEGLEQLEAQTNFTKQELQILYRGFKSVMIWFHHLNMVSSTKM